ncbi:MAG: glycosyltransferase family 9 protein [bacterium]|nr:glycosyltransferase family 9 protein [bacterium]
MKILVIRFGSLGDLVLTFPVLRDLALSCGGEIHFLVREEYAPLLEPLPEIARLHALPRGADLQALRRLAKTLRHEDYELTLDLHGNLRSRMLRLLLAGRSGRWIGTPRQDLRRRLMVATALWPGGGRSRPLPPVYARHRLTLARELGPGYRAAPDAVYPVEEALATEVTDELTDLGLPVDAHPIGIAPGAAWPEKVWPRFAELIERLSDRVPLVLFGGPAEANLCHELAQSATGSRPVVPFCGGRPLPSVVAGLSRCRVMVTGDTGLGHLASAAHVPVITLFGPTVPAFGFPPFGEHNRILERTLPCRPCSLHGKNPCRLEHRACLDAISVDDVIDALVAMRHLPPIREGQS